MSDRAVSTRKANFSERETYLTSKLISENSVALFGTGRSSVPISQKTAIWHSIMEKVNSAFGQNRDTEDLKKKWRDLRLKSKAKAADELHGRQVAWTDAERLVLRTCEPDTIRGVGGRQVGAASLIRGRHPEVAGTSSAGAPGPAPATPSTSCAEEPEDRPQAAEELDDDLTQIHVSPDMFAEDMELTQPEILVEETQDIILFPEEAEVTHGAAALMRPEATAIRPPRQERQDHQLLEDLNVLSASLIDCNKQSRETLEGMRRDIIDCNKQSRETLEGMRRDIRKQGQRIKESVMGLNETVNLSLRDIVYELHSMNDNIMQRLHASSTLPSASSSVQGSPERHGNYPYPRRSPRHGPRMRGGKGTSRKM